MPVSGSVMTLSNSKRNYVRRRAAKRKLVGALGKIGLKSISGAYVLPLHLLIVCSTIYHVFYAQEIGTDLVLQI